MLYFAYGSNMASPRLRARVPGAMTCGVAILPGHRLRFHKIGRDGSAKCDAQPTGQAEDRVVGVVFHIPPRERSVLDACEGLGAGYRAVEVELARADGVPLQAFCYSATRIDPLLRPYDWYREHVLRGALEHLLPRAYVDAIAAVPCWSDPRAERHLDELAIYDR